MDSSIEAILKRAIRFEEDSHNLYASALEKVKNPQTKEWLQELADWELGHKAKLEGLLKGDLSWAIRKSKREDVADLKVGDYLVAPSLGEKSDFQDVLLVAIKREQSAHDFYNSMAGLVEEGQAKELFDLLAKEELKHKQMVEEYYEEYIYKDF
jgi:rubrerythrin